MRFQTMLAVLLPLAATSSAFAADGKFSLRTKGFLAVDLLKYSIEEQADEREETLSSGIGTLDIKFDVSVEDTRFYLKLDLDNSHPDNPYSIFEEAYMEWNFAEDMSVRVGRGVVPFHQKHWAVINSAYFDGGSEVEGGRMWEFTDQDRRFLASFTYGEWRADVRNSITVFGRQDRARLLTDRNSGLPQTTSEGGYKYDYTSKSFDPREQRGIADRLELVVMEGLRVGTGALAYWNRQNPHTSYAFSASASYEGDPVEAWFEAQYGNSSDMGAYEAFKNKKEVVAQIGASYRLPGAFESVVVAADTEFANVRYERVKDDAEVRGATYKVETGATYEINRNAECRAGMLYERLDREGEDLRDNVTLLTSASFRF